ARTGPAQVPRGAVGGSVGEGGDYLFHLHRPSPRDERAEDLLEDVGLPCRSACCPPGFQLRLGQLGRGSDLERHASPPPGVGPGPSTCPGVTINSVVTTGSRPFF